MPRESAATVPKPPLQGVSAQEALESIEMRRRHVAGKFLQCAFVYHESAPSTRPPVPGRQVTAAIELSSLGVRTQPPGEWIAVGQCLAPPTEISLLVALNHRLWMPSTYMGPQEQG